MLHLLMPHSPPHPVLQGVDLTDEELMEYISESTTMSKAMEEYGDRKSCAITTAKRLAAFLGERVFDAGLQPVIVNATDLRIVSRSSVSYGFISTQIRKGTC